MQYAKMDHQDFLLEKCFLENIYNILIEPKKEWSHWLLEHSVSTNNTISAILQPTRCIL